MYLKFDTFQKRKSVCITNTLYWQCFKTKQGQFAPLTPELGTQNSELRTYETLPSKNLDCKDILFFLFGHRKIEFYDFIVH